MFLWMPWILFFAGLIAGDWPPGAGRRRSSESGSRDPGAWEAPKPAKPIRVKRNCFIRIGQKVQTPNPTRLNLLFTRAYVKKTVSFWPEASGPCFSVRKRLPACPRKHLRQSRNVLCSHRQNACGSPMVAASRPPRVPSLTLRRRTAPNFQDSGHIKSSTIEPLSHKSV